MRIVEVRFFPWGPFEDLRLDLEGDVLHVVYGRNEAGKSSALRGIRAALFGVPLRTADDFRHEMGKLCIGARLRRSDGQEIAFVRRKGQKKTLLDGRGSELAADVLV